MTSTSTSAPDATGVPVPASVAASGASRALGVRWVVRRHVDLQRTAAALCRP